MRALRIVLTTMLAAVLLTATAYGAGYAAKQLDHDSNASAPRDRADDAPGRTGDQKPGRTPEASPSPRSDDPSPADSDDPVDRDELNPNGSADPVPTKPTRPAKPELTPGPALLASGDAGAEVRDLQARLKQIAWLSGTITGTYDDQTITAVRGFQAKREIPVTGEVDQRTMDRLHAMTRVPTHGEMHNIAPPSGTTDAALDPRCTTGRALCVDKSSRTVRWVVDGKVVTTMDVRFGATSTPTREGAFTVESMSPDHVSSLYGSSMPFAMFFSRGQAVHYSSDFAARGYNGASHGCVNVRDYEGIKWLFGQVRVGDKVIVYWS